MIAAIASRGDDHGFAITGHNGTTLQGVWQDGRVLITSDPMGPAALASTGGFADHADVQRALGEMPTLPASYGMIVRPEACLEQILPLVNLMLPPEQMKSLQAYQGALRQGNGAGWLMGGAAEGNVHKDQAGGFLALAATAIIMAMAQDPAKLLQIAN